MSILRFGQSYDAVEKRTGKACKITYHYCDFRVSYIDKSASYFRPIEAIDSYLILGVVS